MATDKQSTPRPTDETPRVERESSATTQIGQALRDLGNLTRRLPGARPRRPRPARPLAVVRERVVGLVEALGDSQHPDHADAVELLVELGPPAVPALIEALQARRSWLEGFRAAEALGQIGDARAVGALIGSLQHPNSNVRWGAVRALTLIGDMRALIELRRIAQQDNGRTTWGESVSSTAQAALETLSTRSILGQSLELIKTAVACVLMVLALIVAYSVVTTLRKEFDSFGTIGPGGSLPVVRALLPTTVPTAGIGAPTASAPLQTPTLEATLEPIVVAPQPSGTEIVGTVLQGANVRPEPNIDNQPIGQLARGDEIVFLERSADGLWYLVRLGGRFAEDSLISNPDGSGSGWISARLVSEPEGDVPAREAEPPAPTPTP